MYINFSYISIALNKSKYNDDFIRSIDFLTA